MAQNITNEDKLDLVSRLPERKKALEEFWKKADIVLAEHPEFTETAQKAIEARKQFELNKEYLAFIRSDAALKDPVAKTIADVNEKSREEFKAFQKEMDAKTVSDVIKPYGIEGARANAFLEKELNPGIVGGILKNVVDNGKPQWGGIIGAVAGLVGGMLLGDKMGGWWSIIAIVAGTLLGGWAGNKIGDSFHTPIKGTPPKEPTVGRGQSQKIEGDGPAVAETTEQERIRIAQEAASKPVDKKVETHKNGEHVDNAQSAQLPAQLIPKETTSEKTNFIK
jgi:uncharacterized protein YcfJ